MNTNLPRISLRFLNIYELYNGGGYCFDSKLSPITFPFGTPMSIKLSSTLYNTYLKNIQLCLN